MCSITTRPLFCEVIKVTSINDTPLDDEPEFMTNIYSLFENEIQVKRILFCDHTQQTSAIVGITNLKHSVTEPKIKSHTDIGITISDPTSMIMVCM